MRFAFTEQQQDLRAAVRGLVDRAGGPRVPPPEKPGSGHDAALWRRLAGEIGAAGLAVPEEFGGSGASLLESCVVAEELGRRLVPVPFIGTALAAEALLAAGDPAGSLPGIAAGERIPALAWAEARQWWSTAGCATEAAPDGAEWLLTGEKTFVLDGHLADLVLVVAAADEGPGLFELAAGAGSMRPETPLDPTRPLARLVLTEAPARRISGAAGPVLERCLDAAAVLLSAECVGAADRWLHEIVGHVGAREQFGRPIGSFQAIKHRLADLLAAVETARSLAQAAAWAVAVRDERGPEWAAMAKSLCCETYQDVAAEGVQLHGALGITWEHEAHLHLKRAHGSAHLFGTPRRHRERLERLLD
ncbi:acyl-CoA dehydrogenase family protein [Saccharopolyspora sp. MS10]|uniref:acyl-CoA dehydrogenase family protein n=1 Tax=Saccharopolyspora sp. MS10 TaxID=3385973 RepID=UPI0039A392D2